MPQNNEKPDSNDFEAIAKKNEEKKKRLEAERKQYNERLKRELGLKK